MGFGSVGIRINVARFPFRECARARGCVHVSEFCQDWISAMMATKARKFASVRRSLNLERLPGNKSLVCINAECTFRTDRRCWYICKLACSPVGKTDTLFNSHVGNKMKEKPFVYELLKLKIRKMTTVRTIVCTEIQ